MHGHFYGNFTGNLAHAQSVCTRPFSRGEGSGDEARQGSKVRMSRDKFEFSTSGGGGVCAVALLRVFTYDFC